MCRNIRTLHNFEPPASEAEVHDAALQYVRKISGSSKPSQANAEAFDRAVAEVAAASVRLLDALETSAPAKNREIEAEKRRARAFAASTSRFFGGAVVTSCSSRLRDAVATCSTAASKAALFATAGFVVPLILRTYCSAAARTSSSVTGGSKLLSGLMLRHMPRA